MYVPVLLSASPLPPLRSLVAALWIRAAVPVAELELVTRAAASSLSLPPRTAPALTAAAAVGRRRLLQADSGSQQVARHRRI